MEDRELEFTSEAEAVAHRVGAMFFSTAAVKVHEAKAHTHTVANPIVNLA